MKLRQVRIKRTRRQAAPRNVAAKALREPKFRPQVAPNPKAYRRKPRHPAPPLPEPEEP